jgi:cell division protein FtsQ
MKKILNSIYFLTLSTLLVLLSSVSRNSLAEVKCQDIVIDVDTEGDLFFLNAEMIEELLFENDDSIVGKTYEDINIFLLEEFVDEHPNIAKAELYLTIDGNFCIEVAQRRPIVRVLEEGQSYYLDEEMNVFPLSDKYTARVLQVYWSEMTEVRGKLLRELLGFIDNDNFLDAQITAIEFDENNELILYPRIGDHKIILGDTQNLVKKFDKLKVFYRQGLEKVGWDRYSHINLKFDNQVVCTKR